jgi:heptosyltransferase II
MKIGVFLPNWVGDVCMATPSLHALRQAYPNQNASNELVGISRTAPKLLLEHQGIFDRFLVYKPRSKSNLLSRRKLVSSLRCESFDAILLYTNSLSTALMGWLSGTKRLVGYRRDARGWLLSDSIDPPRDSRGSYTPISAVDYYATLTEHFLDKPICDRAMAMKIREEDRAMANDLWKILGFHPNLPTIVINNHAAKSATRILPDATIISLCKKIVSQTPWQVLLHCAPQETKATQDVCDAVADGRVGSMAVLPTQPMELSLAVFEKADCVLTTDSGARHMAVAMNRPVVTYFGSTDPSWTTTYNLPEDYLLPTPACHPCWKTTCQFSDPQSNLACVRSIEVDTMFEAIQKKINSLRSS